MLTLDPYPTMTGSLLNYAEIVGMIIKVETAKDGEGMTHSYKKTYFVKKRVGEPEMVPIHLRSL